MNAIETQTDIPDECKVEAQSALPDILAKQGYMNDNEQGDMPDEGFGREQPTKKTKPKTTNTAKADGTTVMAYVIGFTVLLIGALTALAIYMYKKRGPSKPKKILSKKKEEKLRMREAQKK